MTENTKLDIYKTEYLPDIDINNLYIDLLKQNINIIISSIYNIYKDGEPSVRVALAFTILKKCDVKINNHLSLMITKDIKLLLNDTDFLKKWVSPDKKFNQLKHDANTLLHKYTDNDVFSLNIENNEYPEITDSNSVCTLNTENKEEDNSCNIM